MINTLMILERVDGLRSFIVPFEPYISFADLCLKMPNADILFCFLLLVFMIPFPFSAAFEFARHSRFTCISFPHLT